LVLFIKRNKGVSAAVALFLAAAVAFTLKLAASERIARANEKLALAEREKSRRSAAIAQISVAEAAESVSDSVALQRALAEVPEDLRTPDWEYFQGRIDTPTFSIIAPKGRSWVGLEDWPSDPERMVVLRSDGEVFAVNVTTGVLQPLWKSSPPGAKEHGHLGVSLDGKLAAIGYKLKSASNTFQVDICNLGDGARVAQISGPSYLRRILMNGSICILIGESKVEAWDHPSARLLWEAPGFFHADFSGDQKSVLLAGDHSRGVEKRDALSGKVLSEGVKGAPDLHPNFPHNGIGSPGWNRFYSPEFGWTRLRAVVPWTGKVQFEVAPTYGNYACTLIPPGDFIAVLGRTSAEGAVLEIRGASSGILSRSLPLLEPLPNQRSSASLRAKEGAVVLRSARALRIWRLASAGSGLWMDFSSFLAGVRCGDTSQLVTGIRRDDVVAMQLCDGAEKDRVKRVRQEMGEWKAKKDIPGFYISPDGARLIVGISGMYGAYRVGSSGLEEIWPPKQIAGLPASSSSPTGAPFVIHPVEDRVWTGSAVYEFSTGRKLVAVTDREGLNVSYSPVWVGVNRIAEIAVKDDQREVESGRASGEKVQIALWDTEAGRLLAKTTASDANWLGVSPDGLHLAEAGADKCVRIRSSRTLEVEREFRAHEDSVTGIAWHPTLPLLVTASKDGCIRIWNRESFRRVEELIADPTVYAIRAEISPNGLELNELRRNGIRVHKPQSFQGPKKGDQ
jgi:WD40 repeat protein